MPSRTAEPAVVIVRSEFENKALGKAGTGEVQRRLSLYERLSNIDSVRKFSVLVAVLVIWELYTMLADVPPLMFSSFSDTALALIDALVNEGLLQNIWNSISTLFKGYVIGIAIAVILVTLAVTTRFGTDVLTTLTAMLNPLPAIALLPMAMIWFGLGESAIIFTLLHSIIWPVALNMHTGFLGVSETQRMVGRNYGLKNISYITKILMPAALPSILTGLRIGWAYAWRTLIAAELVFGGQVMDTSGMMGAEGSSAGGLGWIIFQNQMDLRIPYVFAGLLSVILVGVLIENLIFRTIEERTVRKWGMQKA